DVCSCDLPDRVPGPGEQVAAPAATLHEDAPAPVGDDRPDDEPPPVPRGGLRERAQRRLARHAADLQAAAVGGAGERDLLTVLAHGGEVTTSRRPSPAPCRRAARAPPAAA